MSFDGFSGPKTLKYTVGSFGATFFPQKDRVCFGKSWEHIFCKIMLGDLNQHTDRYVCLLEFRPVRNKLKRDIYCTEGPQFPKEKKAYINMR